MRVGPRQEALQRAVDEPRVELAQRRVAEAELVHRAGAKVLCERIGACDQLEHELAPALRLEIDGDALLVAVVGGEEACARGGQLSRMIAVERLDLDDFGAEIGEHQPARGPHDDVHELDDAITLQRKRSAHATLRMTPREIAGNDPRMQSARSDDSNRFGAPTNP